MVLQPESTFESLTENAIDFMTIAIAQFETAPKYSVINFYSSVELFFKARLLHDHWTLVVNEPGKASCDAFREGNFQSVALDAAIERLERILRLTVSKEAKASFAELKQHRNRLVHFFHPDYRSGASQKTLETIAREQCKGWYHLHGLLTRDWASEFSDFNKPISALNAKMHMHRVFLQAKFETLGTEISRAKQKGVTFSECPACGFESREETVILGDLMRTSCWICSETSVILIAKCVNCLSRIEVEDLGQSTCRACGSLNWLTDLVEQFPVLGSPKDELIDPSRARCRACELSEPPSVVPFYGDWLCLNCLELFKDDEVGYCNWCGERVTIDDAGILRRCFMCID